jgi:hypothetical protein
MAGEKRRGAPKRQQKKPSSATKAKEARKLAARNVGQSADAARSLEPQVPPGSPAIRPAGTGS